MRALRTQSLLQEPANAPRPLYVVMACMRDTRKRSDRTDACFDPLRDTVRPARPQPARPATAEAAHEAACMHAGGAAAALRHHPERRRLEAAGGGAAAVEGAEEEDVPQARSAPSRSLLLHACRGRGVRGLQRRRESLSYLQQAEAVEIRRKSDAFQQRVEDFRAFFLQAAPFAIAEPELTMQHVRWPSAHAHSATFAHTS